MMEVALCLAIIGFALVSILLVLPLGMDKQRETREATVISQDATMFLEAIRGGARGMDDLTNYVVAITNYISFYNNKGLLQNRTPSVWGYTYGAASYNGGLRQGWNLTNGARIIGLMSTPEFTYSNLTFGGAPIANTFSVPFTSNRVFAYVRSFSGMAAEKPPQNNDLMREASFSYKVLCVNAPMAADTNVLANPNASFDQQLAVNLRELRLMFSWPLTPNSSLGFNHQNQSFRTDIAGELTLTNEEDGYGPPLYFYQSQLFNNAP